MEKTEIKETHSVERSGESGDYQETAERKVETNKTSTSYEDDTPRTKKVEVTEETTTETRSDD